MAADLYADYVIVGAGSAGCVLAARLTESGEHKVVVLEAGGDDRPLKEPGQMLSNIMIHTPIGFGKTLNDPKVNWLYETEVDEGSGGRKHKWPKGKVLGGSSSINGKLMGNSADWQLTRPDGVTVADAIYAIETDDGALIQIRNKGLRHGPPEVMDRLRRGEDVDPAEYYFRTVPEFIAPEGRYDWLNRSIFVCSGARYASGIKLWVWRVT